MNEQIDETTIRIDRVANEVDQATTELITTNKKLKVILDKVSKFFRSFDKPFVYFFIFLLNSIVNQINFA